MKSFVRSKSAAVCLILLALLLTFRGGFLIWQKWQHDLRLKLVQNDLETHLKTLWGESQTPDVVVDDQPAGAVAGEIERLWGNQKQAEREHRQKIVELVNEQRQIVNNQTPDVYPLLSLEPHPLLEQSARRAFENIAESGKFEHQDLTALLSRGKPFDRVGENLAAENSVNPTRTVYDWYLSESHRELMLGDWSHIGVWSGWVEDLIVESKGSQDLYVTVAHFGE